MKLNLGCGGEPIDGFLNVDLYNSHPDVVNIDLNKLPLPFPDESFDYILADNVLEHLSVNHHNFMVDIHRILEVDGVIEIFLPFWSARAAHMSFFHPLTYFDGVCGIGSSRAQQCIDLFEKERAEYTRKSLQLCFPPIQKESHFVLRKKKYDNE